MIKKYSQLPSGSKYRFPTRTELQQMKLNGISLEDRQQKVNLVLSERKKLIEQRLLPNGGRVPSTRDDWFQIVSRDPLNNSNWRVTSFVIEGGEEIPDSHIVAQTLTEAPKDNIDYSVMDSLQDVDWEKWAND